MIQWWQIALLTLYAGYQIMDALHWHFNMDSAVFSGFFTDLVMGDVTTGLFIGGSMQLTILGVGTFGGASRIDANSGALVATAFAVSSHIDPQQALAIIGVPVAALLVYTDIACRFANTFIAHMCEADVERKDWGAFSYHYWLGAVSWCLSRMVPVFLALAFGQPVVQVVSDALSGEFAWLGSSLSVAGAALPAVGFAILLRYLPAGKHFNYLIFGFALAALLGTLFSSIVTISGAAGVAGDFNNLSMLMVALVGFALAFTYYKKSQAASAAPALIPDMEGNDDDEL